MCDITKCFDSQILYRILMSIIFAIVFDPELRPKGSLGSAEDFE